MSRVAAVRSNNSRRRFSISVGGKGANQAIGAARLGDDGVFVTWLGRHWMGDQALENYRAERINCDFVSRDGSAASGVELITHVDGIIFDRHCTCGRRNADAEGSERNRLRYSRCYCCDDAP